MADLKESFHKALGGISKRTDRSPRQGEREYGGTKAGEKFADPTNKAYPVGDAAHARNAASRFGDPKNRDKYSPSERKTIEGNIERAERKFGVGK